MKIFQISTTVVLLSLTLISKGQDTVKLKSLRPERPHEIGISILTPLIMMAGAIENDNRYTNLTYRYRLSERRAIKVFAGAAAGSPFNGDPFRTQIIVPSNYPVIYLSSRTSRPSNFQAGLGYEFIRGRRLKHVLGIDAFYANKFEKQHFYYVKGTEVKGPGDIITVDYQTLDTGSYVIARNFNSVGLNLSYSLRYEMSSRWMLSASAIAVFKFSQFRREDQTISNFDFNFTPLGDISLFYKF